MGSPVRNDKPLMFATVAMHADVDMTLVMERDDIEAASIHFGPDGPDLTVEFADVDSLERLAALATEGARRLRERIATNELARLAASGHAERLLGVGVAS